MTASRFTTARLVDAGAQLEATFVPGAGMLCCSLRHGGEELLAQNAGLAAYADSGKTMGIPLLYPWANRLAGFEYSVSGRTVQVPHDPTRVALDDNGLPIHGVIGSRLAWELTRPPGSRPQSLVARLSWSEEEPETFEAFPFRHDLHYEARLADGRLEVEITVHACASDVVPLAFGLHPYLSLPGVPPEQWLIELPAMRHLELDGDQIPMGGDEVLAGQRFELGAREFDDGYDRVSEHAVFSAQAAARRIELEFLHGYLCAQVFHPKSAPFICFEPMTAPTNALRSGDGLRLLEPGARFRAGFSVSVHELA